MQAASGSVSPLQRQISAERRTTLEAEARGVEIKKGDGDESDADARIVPEFSGRPSNSRVAPTKPQCGGSTSKRRSAGPQEKEHKRMKRLLRNRVSAQQARERKKAYLLELEMKTKDLEQRNAELEEKVSTLQRENFMLRQIVKNTTIKNNIAATVGHSGMET